MHNNGEIMTNPKWKNGNVNMAEFAEMEKLHWGKIICTFIKN